MCQVLSETNTGMLIITNKRYMFPQFSHLVSQKLRILALISSIPAARCQAARFYQDADFQSVYLVLKLAWSTS